MNKLIEGDILKSGWFYGLLIFAVFNIIISTWILKDGKFPVPMGLSLTSICYLPYIFSLFSLINNLEYKNINEIRVKFPYGPRIFSFERVKEAVVVSLFVITCAIQASLYFICYKNDWYRAFAISTIIPFALAYQGVFISSEDLQNIWFFMPIFFGYCGIFFPFMLYKYISSIDESSYILDRLDFNGDPIQT